MNKLTKLMLASVMMITSGFAGDNIVVHESQTFTLGEYDDGIDFNVRVLGGGTMNLKSDCVIGPDGSVIVEEDGRFDSNYNNLVIQGMLKVFGKCDGVELSGKTKISGWKRRAFEITGGEKWYKYLAKVMPAMGSTALWSKEYYSKNTDETGVNRNMLMKNEDGTFRNVNDEDVKEWSQTLGSRWEQIWEYGGGKLIICGDESTPLVTLNGVLIESPKIELGGSREWDEKNIKVLGFYSAIVGSIDLCEISIIDVGNYESPLLERGESLFESMDELKKNGVLLLKGEEEGYEVEFDDGLLDKIWNYVKSEENALDLANYKYRVTGVRSVKGGVFNHLSLTSGPEFYGEGMLELCGYLTQLNNATYNCPVRLDGKDSISKNATYNGDVDVVGNCEIKEGSTVTITNGIKFEPGVCLNVKGRLTLSKKAKEDE